MEPSGRTVTRQFSHYQAEIESARMDQQTFDDVVVKTKVSSSHASGFVHMSETAFGQFSTLPQQPLSTLAADPPPVAVNRRLFFFLADPVTTPAIRL